MTTVIQCVLDGGKIRPLEQNKIAKWKEAHKQGEPFEMVLDDGSSSALSPLALKYFAIRDEYAAANAYAKDYAHTELKKLFGVSYPEDAPPMGRRVRLVEYHGEKVWLLSIADYTREELGPLVDGATVALAEVSV